MNDKIKNIVVTVMFIATLVIAMIANIIKKDDDFSISEKRKLEQFPRFSTYKLFNGTFFDKLEKYTTDQFIARENLRALKVNVELKAFQRKDYNNVYKYGEHLIKQEYPLNEKSVRNFICKIKLIQDMYLNDENKAYFVMVPDKNYYVDDGNLKLDYNMLENEVSHNLDFATYININDLVSLSNFYYTDLHWKQETLLPVAERIADTMGISISTDYTEEKITDFKGTYAKQLPVESTTDEIITMKNDTLANCKVYNYEKKKYIDVYDLSQADGNDRYGVYLSGSTPILTIENPEYEGTKELIVFKDSFGSSLVPLLVQGYSKITLLDTRYISTKMIGQYVDFTDKDVLFIYNTVVINNSETMK